MRKREPSGRRQPISAVWLSACQGAGWLLTRPARAASLIPKRRFVIVAWCRSEPKTLSSVSLGATLERVAHPVAAPVPHSSSRASLACRFAPYQYAKLVIGLPGGIARWSIRALALTL